MRYIRPQRVPYIIFCLRQKVKPPPKKSSSWLACSVQFQVILGPPGFFFFLDSIWTQSASITWSSCRSWIGLNSVIMFTVLVLNYNSKFLILSGQNTSTWRSTPRSTWHCCHTDAPFTLYCLDFHMLGKHTVDSLQSYSDVLSVSEVPISLLPKQVLNKVKCRNHFLRLVQCGMNIQHQCFGDVDITVCLLGCN